MRELKFRAWDKKSNKWVTHEQHLEDTKVSASVKPPSILKIFHPDWIFQQYIGIKDRNRKEIFEGDIVSWGYSDIEICIVEEDYSGFALRGKEDVDSISFPDHRSLEVIGNIYENPELLK